MADQTYGFQFRYRMGGGSPTILDLLYQGAETLTKGDMVTLDTGEVDLAVTTDTAILGTVLETGLGVDSTTRIKVICDADAVYGVYDANARLTGATLDIAGTTGAQTVATSSNTEFVVVAESTAAEETLVMIMHGVHAFN